MASAATAFDPTLFPRERYGPGESVFAHAQMLQMSARPQAVAQRGDFILTHSAGVFGYLIRFGERLQYFGADRVFAHWSHAAIFVDDDGNIIEALGGGVQKRNIAVYKDTEYVVVHLPAATNQDDRAQAVQFAEHSLNESYGWLTNHQHRAYPADRITLQFRPRWSADMLGIGGVGNRENWSHLRRERTLASYACRPCETFPSD